MGKTRLDFGDLDLIFQHFTEGRVLEELVAQPHCTYVHVHVLVKVAVKYVYTYFECQIVTKKLVCILSLTL